MAEMIGGIDYAKIKPFFNCDDYVSLRDPTTGAVLLNGIPFTAMETYYVVGFMAALNDPTVVDPERGWCRYTPPTTPPAWLAPFLAALGITWPAQVPAFEAKDILFFADQDCWVRFEGASRVQHFIPKNTYMRFHRRCFMFWVVRDTVSGTLRCWLFG